jgi:hypothetical protein
MVKIEGDRGGSADPHGGTAGGWQDGVKVEVKQEAPQLTPMEQLEAAAAAAAAAAQQGPSSSKRQAGFIDLGRSGTKQPKLWGLGTSSIDFGSMPAPSALQQQQDDDSYEAFRLGPASIPCVSVAECFPPGWSPKDAATPDPAAASDASEQTASLASEEQQQQEKLVAEVTAECRELEGALGGRVALAVHTAASAAAAGLLTEPPVVLDSGCVVVVVSLARSGQAGGTQAPKVQVKQEEGAGAAAAAAGTEGATAAAAAAPTPTPGVHPWASLLLLVPLGYPSQPASCWYVPPSAAEAAGLVPAGAGRVKAEEGEPAQPQVQQRRMAASALRSKAWVEMCTAMEEGIVGSGVAGLARAWYTAVSTAVKLS